MFKNTIIVVLFCFCAIFGLKQWMREHLDTLFVRTLSAFSDYEMKRDLFVLTSVRENAVQPGWCIAANSTYTLMKLQEVEASAKKVVALAHEYITLQTFFLHDDKYLIGESYILGDMLRLTQKQTERLMEVKSHLSGEGVIEYCVSKDISVPL